MTLVKPVLAVAALLVATGLSACSAATATSPATDVAKSSSTGKAASTAGPAVDVCALVPADALARIVGKDPGTGVAAKGKVDGGQCTWKIDDTHSVLAQYTLQPDSYLPVSIYPKPKGADAIAGADRGWANAASNTVLVVKGDKGLLLNYISVGGASAGQSAFDTLGAAIVAKLG